MHHYDPNQITFFAKTDARGQEVPFGIKAIDRARHVYVIGKTGMGKSTLLENMAVQDIKNGNGFAFIDPHGQTAETLLNYIPEERVDDVLYFAPFDSDYPISFNVMEDVGPDKRHLVVSGLMSVFKKIWVDAWSARMEYILSNTLLALLEYPDSTLLGVNRMLSDKAYRLKVIDNITDPAVKSFWVDEFLNYNERYMQEAGDAIKNKTGQFLSNPLIRNVIGQPKSSFDIRQMMDEKKIIIMNLSKGLIGESNANLLGSMLTTRIYLAAMSRADLTQPEMERAPNFYFYVDEFQSFANATFADILSEARKYKLNLTIAHQYIEQMEEEVRNAVFGNVGTTIAFRVGPFDAEILESIFTPKFLAPDLVNLGFAQVYLTLMIDGIGSQPFSAVTLPPIEELEVTRREAVVERSRRLYAHPRAGVETIINAWHEEKFEIPDKYKKGKNNQVKKNQNYQQKNKNNSQHNSQNRPRNNGQSQPRPHVEVPKPESPSQKTAEDLRAVLRTMTKNSEEGANPKVMSKPPIIPNPAKTPVASESKSLKPKSAKKPKTQKTKKVNNDKNQPSLKAALAEALVSGGAEAKKEAPVIKPAAIPKPLESPRGRPAPAAQTPQLQNDTPKKDDPLAPKKLERMMRVTGKDRTPLG